MHEATLLHEHEQCTIGPLQTNAFGDRAYYNLNPGTFAELSAQALFDATFAKSLFNEHSLYIVVGSDSGLLPRYIQAKEIPNGTRYIFIEPKAVLAQLLSEGALNDLDPRMACIAMDQWMETIVNFKLSNYFFIHHVVALKALCAQCDNIKAYHEIHWQVAEALSQIQFQHQFELGSESFPVQQLANLADAQYPASLLTGAFQGKTALILAGGPSLDDAFAWIHQHRAQFVIFAVSRIAKRLLQVDITPDFFVTVDPTQESFDISKEMLSFGSKSILLYAYHTISTLVSQWTGLAFYLGSRVPWTSSFNVDNWNVSGPTVTNSALNAAYYLGFKRILLAGVDLCFTAEGYTHAKGSNEHATGPRFNLTGLEVETNDGMMVPSSPDFMSSSQSLSIQAGLMKAQCHIINLSPHAVKMEHIQYKDVKKIRLGPLKCDVQALVADKILHMDGNQNHFFKAALADLKHARLKFMALKRVAEKGKAANMQMYDDEGRVNNKAAQKTMRQVERRLQRSKNPFNVFVRSFCIRSFLQITRPFYDRENTGKEYQEIGNVFFDSYAYGTNRLIGCIDSAIEKIQARKEETKASPNLKLLIHQCVREGAFGRVRRWRAQWPESMRSDYFNSQFAILESRFVNMINDDKTRHFNSAERDANVAYIKPRADLLFRQRKGVLLEGLLSALDRLDNQADIELQRLLITGYCAELAEDFPAALDAYHALIQKEGLFFHDALVRVGVITLRHHDHHNAFLAVFCLAQNVPVWLPLCARMQQIRGEIQDAIVSYHRYLAQFPDDIVVQLQFAVLLTQEKLWDAASLVLDYIIEKNPEHHTAMQMKKQLQHEREAQETV